MLKPNLPRLTCCLAIVLLSGLFTMKGMAADEFITFQSAPGTWQLKDVTISFADGEHSCVQLAVTNLQTDFEKVTGVKPQRGEANANILVGTVGTNPQIDQWVKSGVLRDLKGKTEKYIIKTIGQQLVIAGSDKRGTVYGIYELSKQMGVSPWYYWADVPVVKHTSLYIKEGEYTDGEPQFYEKVFELILRLKGNYLWPAMWGWAFYADDPENLKTADAMGVMMGTSHHEPMARNHQEYARDRKGWGA